MFSRWDVNRSETEVHKIQLDAPIGGIELSSDGSILTVANGNRVTFFNAENYSKIREVEVPCPIYSASLLQEKNIFVCGGEDFKLYKFNYETGKEIENFKGHFGPVHCVRFSPDGELYASGSEDGTLRLWQTEVSINYVCLYLTYDVGSSILFQVGKTYGLWKCVDSVTSGEAISTSKAEISAN